MRPFFTKCAEHPALVVAAVLALLALCLLVIGRQTAYENRLSMKQEIEVAHAARSLAIKEEDWVLGSPDARVVAVEYFDLECPFCKNLHERRPYFLSRFKGSDVAFVYRHFPLEQIHKNALVEAVALECAGMLKGDQGFFSLQDMIYDRTEGNDTLDLGLLPEFARTLGISNEAFSACREGAEAEARVRAGMMRGAIEGVDRTPSVVLFKEEKFKFVIDAGSEMGMRNLETAIEALLRD